MKANTSGLAFLAIVNLTACANFGAQKSRVDEARFRNLEREIKKRQNVIEELRERNLVLERRVNMQFRGAPPPSPSMESAHRPAPIPQSAPPVPTQTHLEKVEPAASAPDSVIQTGEQKLYSKVLETYRTRNSAELQKSQQLLLKTYPDSVYADNALYLAGMLAFETNDPARAKHFMERVIREYPKGNKFVSALFAKAMLEKREGRISSAREIFKSIQVQYPGSPEAARANAETKILDLPNIANRREG